MKTLKSFVDRLFHRERPDRKKLLIIPIGILAVLASGYLVLTTAVLTPAAEDILPQNRLLLFADIKEPDCSSLLAKKAPRFCTRRSDLLASVLGEYPQRIAKFTDHVAIAVYKSQASDTPAATVRLMRVSNSAEAENYLRTQEQEHGLQEEIRNGVHIYSFREPREHIVFYWRGWLIASTDKNLPELLSEVKDKKTAPVSAGQSYSDITRNLPGSATFAFVKKEAVFALIPEAQKKLLGPFFNSISDMGFSFEEKSDGLRLTAVSESNVSAETNDRTSANDRQSLKRLISILPDQNLLFVAAADRVSQEVGTILKKVEETDPAYGFFIRARARALLAEVFGDGISLDNDVLPLFENRAAFALYSGEQSDTKLVLVDAADENFVAAKYDKFVGALKQKSSEFLPQLLTHRLEDGTEIKEIISCDDCVKTGVETKQGATVTTISAESFEGKSSLLLLGMWKEYLLFTENDSLFDQALNALQNPDSATESALAKHYPDAEQTSEIIAFHPDFLQRFPWLSIPEFSDFSFLYLTTSQAGSFRKLTLEGVFLDDL